MSKTSRQTLTRLGLACALLAAGPAMADNFEFSYRFNTGERVTGSFSGTLAGDEVTNIAQLAVSIDGVAFAGPLQAYSYTAPGRNCSNCFAEGGAVVSFNPMKNNFFFSEGALDNGAVSGVSNYFYIIPWPNGGANTVATQGSINGIMINEFNGQYVPQDWALTAAPVPEPATLSMLLMGLAAVAHRSRRRRARPDESLMPQV